MKIIYFNVLIVFVEVIDFVVAYHSLNPNNWDESLKHILFMKKILL